MEDEKKVELSEEEVQEVDGGILQTMPNAVKCANCGTVYKAGLAKCPNCGKSIHEILSV